MIENQLVRVNETAELTPLKYRISAEDFTGLSEGGGVVEVEDVEFYMSEQIEQKKGVIELTNNTDVRDAIVDGLTKTTVLFVVLFLDLSKLLFKIIIMLLSVLIGLLKLFSLSTVKVVKEEAKSNVNVDTNVNVTNGVNVNVTTNVNIQ